jgi:hypothetical protein
MKASRSLKTTNLHSGVYAFVFNQPGLKRAWHHVTSVETFWLRMTRMGRLRCWPGPS